METVPLVFTMNLKEARLFLNRNNSKILTGLSVVGIGLTVYNAILDTRKAEDHFWAEQSKHDDELNYIKVTWKDYLPTIISAILTAGCTIASDVCAESHTEAAISSYLFSQATLQEYQRKVVERIGVNKERELHDDVIKEIASKKELPVLYSDGGVTGNVIDTGKGNTLFYDEPGDTYFKSDIQCVRSVVNDLNYELRSEMYFDWNELRYRWGLPFKKYGSDLIFDVDRPLELRLVPDMLENGTVRIILDYELYPKRE